MSGMPTLDEEERHLGVCLGNIYRFCRRFYEGMHVNAQKKKYG
jgi:hypothetical protein